MEVENAPEVTETPTKAQEIPEIEEGNKVWVYDRYNQWVCLEDRTLTQPKSEIDQPDTKSEEKVESQAKIDENEAKNETPVQETTEESVITENPVQAQPSEPTAIEDLKEDAVKSQEAKNEGSAKEIKPEAEAENEEVKKTIEYVEVEYMDLIENNKVYFTQKYGLVFIIGFDKDSNQARVVHSAGLAKIDLVQLKRSFDIDLSVHSSSGAHKLKFKADSNFQVKNFFNNVLRIKLKEKFNFSSFEVFHRGNCVKIVDEIQSDFNVEAAVKKIQDAYDLEVKEWEKQETEHVKMIQKELDKLKEEWKANHPSEDPKKEEAGKAEGEIELVKAPLEEESSGIKEGGKQEAGTGKAELGVKEVVIKDMTDVEAKKVEEVNDQVKEESPTEEVAEKKEPTWEQLVQAKIKELASNVKKPEDPHATDRVKYWGAPLAKELKDEQILNVKYSSKLGQFPSIDSKSEHPTLQLEIVLAPLQSLQVCQMFEKILYVKNPCPKSSFSPSEPILFYGFSLYGPFPNPLSASAFKFTVKIGNSRTNEVQILRANIYDQKEKFYKFFLTNPMYVDAKDFVNIVSIKNDEKLAKFETGLSKKLVDSTKWELEAFKDHQESSDKENIQAPCISGHGAAFVLSSDSMYFYGSDGVRFCLSNHYYQAVGSVYYEKV